MRTDSRKERILALPQIALDATRTGARLSQPQRPRNRGVDESVFERLKRPFCHIRLCVSQAC